MEESPNESITRPFDSFKNAYVCGWRLNALHAGPFICLENSPLFPGVCKELHIPCRISSFVKVLDDVAEISNNDTKPRLVLQFKFCDSKLLYATLYHTINSSCNDAAAIIVYGRNLSGRWNKITVQIKRILHARAISELIYLTPYGFHIWFYPYRVCCLIIREDIVSQICGLKSYSDLLFAHQTIYSYSDKEKQTSCDIYHSEEKNESAGERTIPPPNIPQLRLPSLSDFRVFSTDRHSTLSFLTRSLLFLIASDRENRIVVRILISLLLLVDDKITPNRQ